MEEDDLIKSFVELTHCRDELAKKYLTENHWNINYALNDFYDKELGSFVNEPANPKKIYPTDLTDLFNRYSDQENPDGTKYITFEGMIKFIEELGIFKRNNDTDNSTTTNSSTERNLNLNGPETEADDNDISIVILAKLLSWKNMNDPLDYEQFCNSWFMQGCSTLKDMRLLLSDLNHRLYHDPAYFVEIYNYTFNLILDVGSTQLDVTTATEYWRQFLVTTRRKIPINVNKEMCCMWLQFLNDAKKTFITFDCWKMILQFFQRYSSFQELASDYDETAAWPYIIDEFYEYLEDQSKI